MNNGGCLYVVTAPKKDSGVRDKYHYKEYSPKELEWFLADYGFYLCSEIEVVSEYYRMYAKFILIKQEYDDKNK